MKNFIRVFLLFAVGSMPAVTQERFDLSPVLRACARQNGGQWANIGPRFLERENAWAKADTDFLSQFGPRILERFQWFQYAGCLGQYKAAGLDSLRNSLTKAKWTRVANSDGDTSEVYLLQLAGEKIGGIAILSPEPARAWPAVILGDFTAGDLTMPNDSTMIKYGDALIPDISTKITYGDPVDSPKHPK